MRVFRKRKKFGNFRGAPADAAPPLPDVVYQMGAEVAAQQVAYNSLPDSFFDAVNSARHEEGYDSLPIYPHVPVADENPLNELSEMEIAEGIRAASPLNFIANILGRSRSKSRERSVRGSPQHFARAHSPEHFAQRPLGSPVKFRRRPVSPGFVQPRASSPFLFAQHDQQRAGSPFLFDQRTALPDHLRRLHRAQLSQELQAMERQRELQNVQQMFMAYQTQAFPQFQQQQQQQQQFFPMMNPNLDMQALFMMPQQQFYPHY